MPAAFDNCVARGGRVRRVSGPRKDMGLSANQFINFCFIGGKSFRGEVRTKKESFKGGDTMKFKEDLAFTIQEGTINEEKRTVKVCALATCLSKNNRYYPPQIVEGASGTLKGKKSYADHDDRSTKSIVGKIVGENYKEGKLYADIKFSKAKGTASQTWEKVNDGTLDAVSIAAHGEAKEVEMEGKTVFEVTKLDIRSVDFVPEGGIEDAKVLRVYEDINKIPQTKEVKNKMIENLKQLKDEYPDLVSEIESKNASELKEATEKVEKLEGELADIKLASFKEAEIAKLENPDNVKSILKDRVSGRTEEEIKASIKKELEYIESVVKTLDKEAKIDGIPEDKKKKEEKEVSWTSQMIREDERIPEQFKGQAINLLWNKSSKDMLEFLKSVDVEL